MEMRSELNIIKGTMSTLQGKMSEISRHVQGHDSMQGTGKKRRLNSDASRSASASNESNAKCLKKKGFSYLVEDGEEFILAG